MKKYRITFETACPEEMRDIYERATKIVFDAGELQWLDNGKHVIIINPKNDIRPI
jgi:hypothetical protein